VAKSGLPAGAACRVPVEGALWVKEPFLSWRPTI
jgi:hypothetical protein